jgi:hypothetical protein
MRFAIAIVILTMGCYRYSTPQQEFVERSQWSTTEMNEYEAACVHRQPRGVKPEEAQVFCECKTLGLAVHSSSPAAAERAVHPTAEDAAAFRRTGEVPEAYQAYSRVVQLCQAETRKKFGIPEVALDTGVAR